MKALLIEHETAGDAAPSRKTLAAMIEKAGWKVACLKRKQADAEAIADARPDLVVVAGGDGTVARVVRALPDRSVPIAIVPTGTANDIARSLGVVGSIERLIGAWDMDRRRRLDVGCAHGPWGHRTFVEGVGFGAFADSLGRAREVDGKAKLRAGRLAFADALRDAEALAISVSVDGREIDEPMLLLEVMLVSLVGPRLLLSPDADPGDGRLHLSWLAARKRRAMRDWLDAGAEGPAPLAHDSGLEVGVTGGGLVMRIDDSSCRLEPGSALTVRIESEPVQILAPAEAPALAAAQ